MSPTRTIAADLEAVQSFKKLFETAPDGMMVIDAAGRIILTNPQVERLFGYTPEQLAGQVIDILLPDGPRAAHARHRADFMAQPRTRLMGSGLALTARRRNGSEFPVEVALSPMEMEAGLFVVASIRDITETRRAQQAIKRAGYSAQLARLGEKALASRDLDELLAAIPPMVAETLQSEIVIVYLLDASRQQFQCKGAHGLAPDEITALNEPNRIDLQPGFVLNSAEPVIVDDYAAEARFLINPVMRSRNMRSGIGVALSDGRDRIGTLTARSSRSMQFKEDESHFLKSVGNLVASAIDRLRTEERLQHSQRLESLGQLTGGIAHDFNNLLTVISGNLQLLEDVIQDNAEAKPLVKSAMRATQRGAELTSKLLTFSRRQALRPQTLLLDDHLPALIELLGRTLGEHIRITTHLAPSLPPCRVDPAMLDNALLNLALNARDAMPGGGSLSIAVAAAELDSEYSQRHPDVLPGRYLSLSVTDTGEGMAPDVLAHALEPFFTTKEAGKGSGLGLAMVYGFVKQSGGHLSLYSETGLGTTVRLYLPAAAGAATTAEPASRSRQGRGETVLVVEDDAEVRKLAVSFLMTAGYRVIEAADAAQALVSLDAHPETSLLFSDVVLAGTVTGPALAATALQRRPGLKVVLTTGYAKGALPEHDGSGRFPLLRKPYRREELAEVVRAELDGGDGQPG